MYYGHLLTRPIDLTSCFSVQKDRGRGRGIIQSIEGEPKGKEESESENDGSSISTLMKSTLKRIRKEKEKRFCARNQSKRKQVLERTFDHFSKSLGNLTDAVKGDSSQLPVEWQVTRKKRRNFYGYDAKTYNGALSTYAAATF